MSEDPLVRCRITGFAAVEGLCQSHGNKHCLVDLRSVGTNAPLSQMVDNLHQRLTETEAQLQVQTQRADTLEKVWAHNETAYKERLTDAERANYGHLAHIELLTTRLTDLVAAVQSRKLLSGKADVEQAVDAAERAVRPSAAE